MRLLPPLILSLVTPRCSFGYNSADTVAEQVGEKLHGFMKKQFDKEKIKDIYNTQTYKVYSGLEILNEVRANVSLQFRNSERALANIRESALKSYYDYQGDRHDFDFLERFKNITHKGRPVKYYQTANFKREISVANSSLVLPLDVYYNWSEVRETILWTASMDEVFMTNWSPNKTGSATLLQYIGTPHGVMRVYPSYYTPRVGKWVTYDHRFRIWYAVGAMESNKIVFLMDKSGTLVGEPVKLMREMAINMIKTMISDEDYISVLTFNQVVEPLGCGTDLVRARSRIKEILNGQIRNLRPQGAGNLTEAIRMGFEVLNKSKGQETCHKTLVLFTDYTQLDVVKILRNYMIDDTVKVVILQVGKDIMFASDLAKAAYAVGGIYARIEDLSDISPTILKLTSTYTSLVDDNDLQVKTTPMYKDASTEEYITTLVLPVVTDKKANWTKQSTLQDDKGSFLGVAAVDIESKSLGQYPLSNARGCYAITVDLKGSVLYHPVLYRTKESIEIDQKLHLYSFMGDGTTMKVVERDMVFQNFTNTTELNYVEVSDSAMSKRLRSFATKHYFSVMGAVSNKTSLLYICNRKTLAFPTQSNVKHLAVLDVIPENLGQQRDKTRNTAYCNYSHFSDHKFRDVEREDETVDEYVKRKLQFPECHGSGFEIFDDFFMVTRHLLGYIDNVRTVTTASGSRFEMNKGNEKLRRINGPNTRDKYTRMVSLVTNDNNNEAMVAISNITTPRDQADMFELSQVVYHLQSDSYPLMMSVTVNASQLNSIIQDPFKNERQEVGGTRFLVDENGFVLSSSNNTNKGEHLARLFPRLMQHLLDGGIYNQYNHTECYFSCEDTYPKEGLLGRSSASTLGRYIIYPSVDLLLRTTSTIAALLTSAGAQLLLLLTNPIKFVASMPDSSTEYNPRLDWRSIQINLTCCHIHPFISRNFSIPVPKGSIIDSDATCAKYYKYSAVPDTNLLLVWAWCQDELCYCEEPYYRLETYTDHILNPCDESDVNYNPAMHCTSTLRGPPRSVSGAGTHTLAWTNLGIGIGVWSFSLL